MNNPNQILGAERVMGIGQSTDGDTCGQNTCAASQGYSPDRTRTISATVEVPASYGFDAALRGIRQGHRVTRAGWNGPGQYVQMQSPEKYSRMTQPYAVLRNSIGDLVPWVPSQGDLFASDWAVLPD